MDIPLIVLVSLTNSLGLAIADAAGNSDFAGSIDIGSGRKMYTPRPSKSRDKGSAVEFIQSGAAYSQVIKIANSWFESSRDSLLLTRALQRRSTRARSNSSMKHSPRARVVLTQRRA